MVTSTTRTNTNVGISLVTISIRTTGNGRTLLYGAVHTIHGTKNFTNFSNTYATDASVIVGRAVVIATVVAVERHETAFAVETGKALTNLVVAVVYRVVYITLAVQFVAPGARVAFYSVT